MVLSGWPTLIVAMLVAAIAYLQWRTARNKLALDLFDRRFAVFMDVRKIASHGGRSQSIASGSPTGFRDNFDPGLPNEIIARGRFLFGADVQGLLEQLHRLVTKVETHEGGAMMDLDRLYKEKLIPAFDRYLRIETRPLSWRRAF